MLEKETIIHSEDTKRELEKFTGHQKESEESKKSEESKESKANQFQLCVKPILSSNFVKIKKVLQFFI
jgi:hypothetical protein